MSLRRGLPLLRRLSGAPASGAAPAAGPAGGALLQHYSGAAPDGAAASTSEPHIASEWFMRQRQRVTLGNRMPIVTPSSFVAPSAVIAGDVDLLDRVRPRPRAPAAGAAGGGPGRPPSSAQRAATSSSGPTKTGRAPAPRAPRAAGPAAPRAAGGPAAAAARDPRRPAGRRRTPPPLGPLPALIARTAAAATAAHPNNGPRSPSGTAPCCAAT